MCLAHRALLPYHLLCCIVITMTIKVKFFAHMRERMGRPSDDVQASEVKTVADVWARVSGNQLFPPSILVAVNMEYCSPERTVKDGDEVAFFPPVTGG
jgi:molybdopterin synthase sulfur carrier subunit